VTASGGAFQWYLGVDMSTTMPPEDLRRWVGNQRAAQERVRESAREAGFVQDPIQAALDLIELASALHGWPVPEDEVRQREDEHAREAWARLRESLGGP